MGIIPADAGNTQTIAQHVVDNEDHPRGCGEHGRARRRMRRWSESSPRMRGTRGQGRMVRHYRGIIPADAGSTGLDHGR